MSVKVLTLLFVVYSVTKIASSGNFHILNLSNCLDEKIDYQKDSDIEVKDVTYEKNEKSFVDILHGKYIVHVHNDHSDSEIVFTFFSCPLGSTAPCKDNPKQYIEKIDCERFLTDSTGPWYVFAPAMDQRNVCATATGSFDFTRAHLNSTFVEKYIDIKEGHYQIKVVHHVPGESMDTKNMRSCIEFDFDILP
ncbi:hypothetical protein PVAND_014381 [Polypedilum vanderplanki]|uniref:Uncharacterized protein n=1 Tax=Polypedilum vanderplanki TaxID=319348 RepID=A0A9J6B9F5_POLVA|nr:hypothetical protein PVAND_014381 [Polypedilum vanderplanki]